MLKAISECVVKNNADKFNIEFVSFFNARTYYVYDWDGKNLTRIEVENADLYEDEADGLCDMYDSDDEIWQEALGYEEVPQQAIDYAVKNNLVSTIYSKDGLMQVKLSEAKIVLWKVTFEIRKDYDKKQFTFVEAKEHFYSKSDGIGPDETQEELDHTDESWYLSTEFSYYNCDSGHGANIINDCLIAIKEDGIEMDQFDWEYRWQKIESSDEGYYDLLKMGLSTYSKNIKLQGEIIVGENLSEFVDD